MMKPDSAIDVVAHDLLSRLDLEDWIEWEDMPLIGAADFERVRDCAQEMLRSMVPPTDALERAHDLLQSRVNNDAA